METMRSVKKLIIVLLALTVSQKTFAQNHQDLIKAFSTSYDLEAKKEYGKAFETLQKVYSENSYEINLRMGWLAYLNNQQEVSLKYYKKAMELMPYAIEPCFGYAFPAAALNKWDDVLNIYDKILSIDPNNTIASYRKGLILYNRGDFSAAEKMFEKVVNLYPFDYDGLIMLAWTKFKMGKNQEAKVLFQKTLLNRPGDKSAAEGLELVK
jgi:tetratricopeptide (TPR) repeat protein